MNYPQMPQIGFQNMPGMQYMQANNQYIFPQNAVFPTDQMPFTQQPIQTMPGNTISGDFLQKLEGLSFVTIEDLSSCFGCSVVFRIQGIGPDQRPSPPYYFEIIKDCCSNNFSIFEGNPKQKTGRVVDEAACCAHNLRYCCDEPYSIRNQNGEIVAWNNRPSNCCPAFADGVWVMDSKKLQKYWIGTECFCIKCLCICVYCCPRCNCKTCCCSCCTCVCCPDEIHKAGFWVPQKTHTLNAITQVITCARTVFPCCGRLYFRVPFSPGLTKEDKIATITATIQYYLDYHRFPDEKLFF